MDVDGFKLDLSSLSYGPLELMVINFTCHLSLVCVPPRWSPLKEVRHHSVNRSEKSYCGMDPLFMVYNFSFDSFNSCQLQLRNLGSNFFKAEEKNHQNNFQSTTSLPPLFHVRNNSRTKQRLVFCNFNNYCCYSIAEDLQFNLREVFK